MPLFTCLSCHVAFKDGESQRDHFQSDWHRYNLKRKIAELPPISAESFKERVLSLKAKEEEDSLTQRSYCDSCKKLFSNTKSYQNHLNSKKHLEKAKFKETKKNFKTHTTDKKINSEDEDIEIEEVDSDEWEGDPIPPTDCLFCHHSSKNVKRNLHHMTSVHSFFIPDLEYCIDISGLLTYLGEKIGSGMECLWCSGKRKFSSVDAVRKHMNDKGHKMILFEGESMVEYYDYYNYSSSYPDADSSVDADQPVEPFVISGDAFELVLPSGAVIGHRSLLRYYRQHLNPNRAIAISKAGSRGSSLQTIMSQYRSLGWKEGSRADVAKRARDVHFMKNLKSRYHLKLGVKANKLQKHFRPQVNF